MHGRGTKDSGSPLTNLRRIYHRLGLRNLVLQCVSVPHASGLIGCKWQLLLPSVMMMMMMMIVTLMETNWAVLLLWML